MNTLLTPTFFPFIVLLEVISLALIMLDIRVIKRNLAMLPEKVPMHFGLNGTPDSWQAKKMLWTLPGLALFMYLLFTGIAVTIPLFPQGYHGLARPLTPELLGQMNRASVLMLEVMKVEMIGLFFYLTQKIIILAKENEPRLSPWVMVSTLVVIFGSVGVFMLYLKYVLHV